MNKCPRCGSRYPHLHPAVQFEGEANPCPDDFHRRVVGQNTPERIASVERMLAQDRAALGRIPAAGEVNE